LERKELKIAGISIWRILAYFIIYSVAGYIIESIYALVVYGVIESRQSFLYGPFCSIYGVGAVVMICALQRFKKDGHTLFFGGFLVGSITEYLISLIGELIFNTKWWDYSENFLNLNGRICFIYSLFWGLLGVYLIRVLNPRIDKMIDWIKSKFNLKGLKILTITIVLLMFLDCIISGRALSYFLIRTVVENDLDVANKQEVVELYNKTYVENKKLSNFIYKYWGNRKMVRAFPNIKLELTTGESVYLRDYYPDIKSYYFKFDR